MVQLIIGTKSIGKMEHVLKTYLWMERNWLLKIAAHTDSSPFLNAKYIKQYRYFNFKNVSITILKPIWCSVHRGQKSIDGKKKRLTAPTNWRTT